jgi:hypothetical protein
LWAVPTIHLINFMVPLNVVSYMDPIVNLINNTVWSTTQAAYAFPAAKEAAVVAAFNTAWT